MTSQPPTDPPARPSINQASRRYLGSQGRNVTPKPSPRPASSTAEPAAAGSAVTPCPDRRRHDRRVLLLHRVRYVAITLALMIATGATVALICTRG
ncbi:hypothetical protein [Catenuloplanes japonicus]|uniref:hypothetical protein n=1 Tax=Catenuloplanes japonicus TaxID=33876 RepID=UPI0012FAEF6E|nr:hypothetical protein [Catenuloplanes japonicus]